MDRLETLGSRITAIRGTQAPLVESTGWVMADPFGGKLRWSEDDMVGRGQTSLPDAQRLFGSIADVPELTAALMAETWYGGETNEMIDDRDETDLLLDWINANPEILAPYPGEWVAFAGRSIVAHAPSFADAANEAKANGFEPFLVPVPVHVATDVGSKRGRPIAELGWTRTQAASARAQLMTFADAWDDPAMDAYDDL